MAMSSMSPNPFLVKAVNTTDNRPFRVSADKIDTSRWPYRYIPQLPTMASTPRYGQVEILQVEKTRDLMRFYQHIMTTELAEIRCRDVWYIVMAWHFYVHTSVSSESLAEAVGSYLAVTRRHNINGTSSMKHLVWSSKLRAVGLKRLRRGGWNLGSCSKYTFSVLRAGRMAFCRATCTAKKDDHRSNAQRSPIVE